MMVVRHENCDHTAWDILGVQKVYVEFMKNAALHFRNLEMLTLLFLKKSVTKEIAGML